MELIDTHAHLDEVDELEGAILRAREAGVHSIVAVSSDYLSCWRSLKISEQFGQDVIYPALGIHPWRLDPSETDRTIDLIEQNVQRIVAVGEIGLDFWLKEARKSPEKREVQKEVFKKLLGLCKRHKKPALIHARGAWKEALHIVQELEVPRAVFHWFIGPPEILDRVLEAGYLISSTPAAAYGEQHQRAISETPLERLLIETDSPVTYQGERSEPSHLLKTLEAVSRIKGIDRDRIAGITTDNARSFFHI